MTTLRRFLGALLLVGAASSSHPAQAQGRADARLDSLTSGIASGRVSWDGPTRDEVMARLREAPGEPRTWSAVLQAETAASRVAGRPLDLEVLELAFGAGVGLSVVERAFRAFLDRPDLSDPRAGRYLAQLELLYEPGPESGRAEAARAWVQRQDPAPSTEANERLVIHLARVRHALRAYAEDDSPTGFDARGVALVRYGEPDRTRAVSFDEADLLKAARNRGLSVTRPDFPDNEVWLYDALSDQGVFIFVRKRRGGFELGGVNDLIPRTLRSRGQNTSPRSVGYAEVGLLAARYVLGQLALFHPSYSNRYGRTANYVSYVEESTVSGRLNRRVNSRGRTQTPEIAGFSRGAARTLQQAVNENEREDENLAISRRETMPAEVSPVSVGEAPVRLVRFLEPDGRTVNVALWGLPGDGVRRSAVWEATGTPRLLADTVASGAGARATVDVDGGALIGVQVDRPAPATSWRTEAVGYARARPALAADAPLEVSDPLPFRAGDVIEQGEALRAEVGRDRVTPLYGTSLRGLDGVGVYLEAYFPRVGGAFQVRYRVERRRRGRLLRRARSEADEYPFVRQVTARTVPIAFLVDRANWDDADEVTLDVEVEDLGSGAVVRRSLDFTTD